MVLSHHRGSHSNFTSVGLLYQSATSGPLFRDPVSSFDIPTAGAPSPPRTTQLAKGNRVRRRTSFGPEIFEKPRGDPTPHPQSPIAPCFLCPPSTPYVSHRLHHTLMVVPVLSLPFFTCAATINACKDYFMFPIPTTTVYGIAPEERSRYQPRLCTWQGLVSPMYSYDPVSHIPLSCRQPRLTMCLRLL